MLHTEVDSSHVKSVGYDPIARRLELKFRNGTTYHHFGVPPEEHEAMMASDSIGVYYHQNIRDRYESRKK